MNRRKGIITAWWEALHHVVQSGEAGDKLQGGLLSLSKALRNKFKSNGMAVASGRTQIIPFTIINDLQIDSWLGLLCHIDCHTVPRVV